MIQIFSLHFTNIRESLKLSTLGPAWDTLFSLNCVEKYFTVLSPFFPCSTWKSPSLYAMPLSIEAPNESDLLPPSTEDVSEHIQKWKASQYRCPPVKVSCLACTAHKSICKIRWLCPTLEVFCFSFICSAFSHHCLAVP